MPSITIRVPEKDKAEFTKAAKAMGVSLSAYLRLSAKKQLTATHKQYKV